MLSHNSRTSAQNGPSKKRAYKRVAESYPSGGKTEVPTKLSGITYENNRGKIRSSESESGKPRAYGASAQYESVNIGSVLPAVQADTDHHCKKYDQQLHKPYLLHSGDIMEKDGFTCLPLYMTPLL